MVKITPYGFEMEAMRVRRLCTHNGYAVIEIATQRQVVQIESTPSGLLRIGKLERVKKPALNTDQRRAENAE